MGQLNVELAMRKVIGNSEMTVNFVISPALFDIYSDKQDEDLQ